MQPKLSKLCLIMASDCQTVGGMVQELKELLAENFSSPQVKYVPRECNRVAHELCVDRKYEQ